jgi:hypothetical protein
MLTLVLTMVLGAGIATAATLPFTFQARTKVIQGDGVRYEVRPYTYYFRVEVISDQGGVKTESHKDGKPFIEAVPEERYAIRLYNPLPVRVGVNLTVDGLSSISGKPVGPSKGKKWIIQPHSFVTIRGWQVGGDDARRFYFTSKEASYAAWRSNAWGRDLSVNCGVIGAAYFWSKDDMEDWLESHPVYEPAFREEISQDESSRHKAGAAAPSVEKQQAGTGMGERESHSVRNVEFHYDTGMYRAAQAVVIYYDFALEPPRPRPFTDDYAPEMPMR